MASNSEPSDICINIMMSTGIYDVMILNRIENGFDLERGKSSSREHLSVKDYLEEKANKEYNKKVFKKSYLNDNGYVCFNIDSSILKPDYVFHKFNQILKNNNLRPIRFNDLRHSCASLLLSNKVSMKDIQIWLGHSSYNTTANIYTHVDIELK